MRREAVVVGAIYQVVDFGSRVFIRGGRTEHCTYTPGSVVKVVGIRPHNGHIATELLMGAVTEVGRDFDVNEYGLHGHWVHAEELEPLHPDQHANNTPTCDSCQCSPCRAAPDTCDAVTKEPAHDP